MQFEDLYQPLSDDAKARAKKIKLLIIYLFLLSIILEFLISFSNLMLESVHMQMDESRFPI